MCLICSPSYSHLFLFIGFDNTLFYLPGCLFPRVLTYIVHRKFWGSQEIWRNVRKKSLDLIGYSKNLIKIAKFNENKEINQDLVCLFKLYISKLLLNLTGNMSLYRAVRRKSRIKRRPACHALLLKFMKIRILATEGLKLSACLWYNESGLSI